MNLRKVAKTVIIAQFISLTLMLFGCNLIPTESLPRTALVAPEATHELEALAYTNVAEIMSGICFAAANDAAGQIFVLRTPGELNTFYALADNSGLCRRPVTRATFDFADGRVIVGMWSAGRGCTAHHEILHFVRDDEALSIDISLRLVIEGNCPYELVRPFWISIPVSRDYAIMLEVE